MALKTVRLYYLGGITGKNSLVSSGARSFALPPKGDYLDLPEHVAIDLERKHKYMDEAGNYVSVFTRSKNVADRVKAGLKPYDTRKVLDANELTDAQLLEVMKARGLQIQIVQPTNAERGEESKEEENSQNHSGVPDPDALPPVKTPAQKAAETRAANKIKATGSKKKTAEKVEEKV